MRTISARRRISQVYPRGDNPCWEGSVAVLEIETGKLQVFFFWMFGLLEEKRNIS